MKILEPYSNDKAAFYEGTVFIKTNWMSDELAGYFEAIQSATGMLVIGCHFPEFADLFPTGLKATLRAIDHTGWSIETEGDLFCTSANVSSVHGHTSTITLLHPERLRANKVQGRKLEYLGANFSVTNFMLPNFTSQKSDEVSVEVQAPHLQITITPLADYPERSRRLRAISGVEQTCNVKFVSLDKNRYSLDNFEKYIELVILVLRLSRGNKLDWLYGEGLDDDSSESWERIHKSSVTSGFSTTFNSLGWEIDLAELIKGIFENTSSILKFEELKRFTNYFIECCDSNRYLEVRGLLAATLLDALTLKHSISQNKDEIMSENEFKKLALPELRRAIGSINIPSEIRNQLKDNVKGTFRTSFRRRLTLLNSDLHLCMEKSFINRVIQTRNDLVHKGTFSSRERTSWYDEYKRLLWVSFSALCRLWGYKGTMPTSP